MGIPRNSNDGGGGDDDDDDDDRSNEHAPDKQYPAHVNNPELSASMRYGLIVWWLATLALLLASDIGSGVKALTQTVPDERLGLTFQSDVQTLLKASVFTSVAELWKAGSKALSIFVVIASIAWPYIKLLLTLYAWVTPIRRAQRREYFLVALDLLGKWSLADVVVFIVIVVVFRETIPIGAGYLEVWIRPQWGLYGFISASMMSLITTHVVLYQHRRVVYGPLPSLSLSSSNNDTTATTPATTIAAGTRIALVMLSIIAFATYLAGSLLTFFEVTNIQQGIVRETEKYSLTSIGQDLPDAKRDYEVAGGLVYLQLVWFLLGIVIPLAVPVVLITMLFLPASRLRTALTALEVTLAWSCSEVVLLSTVLAIREIPKFAEGLIETGCTQCYTVDTQFTSPVAVLAVGTALTLAAALLVLRLMHGIAYGTSTVNGTTLHPQPEDDEGAAAAAAAAADVVAAS